MDVIISEKNPFEKNPFEKHPPKWENELVGKSKWSLEGMFWVHQGWGYVNVVVSILLPYMVW
jgi:hypothetical protein